MTAAEFRRMALHQSGAAESTHMNHPDFRIAGRIFASLGYPADGFAMVKLTPEAQRQYIRKAAAVFAPCAGAWGRQGCTSILLATARKPLIAAALRAAAGKVRGPRS